MAGKLKQTPYLILILVSLFVVPFALADATQGLQVFFTMNGTHALYGNYNLTTQNSPIIMTEDGRTGMFFNNSVTPGQRADTGYQIPEGSSFSVSMWVHSDYASATWVPFIVDQSDSNIGFAVRTYFPSEMVYTLTDGFNGMSIDNNSIAIGDSVWKNYIYTYDNSTNEMKYYVNGALAQSASPSPGVSVHPNTLCIGSFFSCGSISNLALGMNGDVAGVAVWTNAINDTAIAQVYGETISPFNGSQFVAPPNCTVNWTCAAYGSCSINNESVCIAVHDNNDCEVPYAGNMSEFTPKACVYSPPHSDVVVRTQKATLLLISDIVAFILIVILDGAWRRKSPGTAKLFDGAYKLLLVIAILALLGVMVGI